jgi:hypothetical protein
MNGPNHANNAKIYIIKEKKEKKRKKKASFSIFGGVAKPPATLNVLTLLAKRWLNHPTCPMNGLTTLYYIAI